MKKRAFTLAEILIAMTIIGVIAVLMLSTLQNAQEKALEVQTAHFHSMMSQAIKHYMVDQKADSLADTDMSTKSSMQGSGNWHSNEYAQYWDSYLLAIKGVDDFMYKYLNIKKVCDYTDRFDCFNRSIKNLNGEKGELRLWINTNGGKVYVLENGNVISMRPCDNDVPAIVQVDINGKKGPNRVGRDIWEMNIYADGFLSEHLHKHMMDVELRSNPTQLKEELEQELKNQADICVGSDGTTNWQYGAGCFAKFEDNGYKFDY